MLASGMTFVILTGGIDLSVGSILAASAMVALIASLIPGWGLLGIPAALLTGLFFGLAQRRADRVREPAAVHRHARLADGGARPGAAASGSDTTIFNPDLPFAFIGNGSLPLGPASRFRGSSSSRCW